jgi:hypothetical protein
MHPLSTRVLTGRVEDGKVVLTYRLGMADGIAIYCRRDCEPEFTLLTEDDPGPFVDDRPKDKSEEPEIRHYRAILLYSGEENRQLSDELVLVVP